jgi:hypothetical protein
MNYPYDPRSKTEESSLLSLIGVDQTKALPSVDQFPASFNKEDGLAVWRKVLSSTEYKSVTRDHWDTALRLYLHACDVAGIFPFARSTQQSNNDTTIRFLTNARRKLQWYFKLVGMFDKISPLFINRSYTFSSNHFEVTTEAQLLPINDPTFGKWLRMTPYPGFRPGIRSTVLTKLVQNTVESEIRLDFDLQRKLRPVFWINIHCHTPITYSSVGPPASKEELTEYAEKTIWLPLVRSHRYPGNMKGWRLL